MARKKRKKSEIGVWSSLVFGLLGALICSMLFEGEARTYGQLVAGVGAPAIGQMDWWKTKPYNLHIWLIVLMPFLTILIALRHFIGNLLKDFTYGKL